MSNTYIVFGIAAEHKFIISGFPGVRYFSKGDNSSFNKRRNNSARLFTRAEYNIAIFYKRMLKYGKNVKETEIEVICTAKYNSSTERVS